MPVGWRVTKKRRVPYDGTGAALLGGRWHSPGWQVIHASDSFAGALLEILAHALRPRTLPGPHHAVRIEMPEEIAEWLGPDDLTGWHARGSPEARAFGDRWLNEKRTAVLVVPAVTSRPIGRTIMINPRHPSARRIEVSEPFDVPWDERLY